MRLSNSRAFFVLLVGWCGFLTISAAPCGQQHQQQGAGDSVLNSVGTDDEVVVIYDIARASGDTIIFDVWAMHLTPLPFGEPEYIVQLEQDRGMVGDAGDLEGHLSFSIANPGNDGRIWFYVHGRLYERSTDGVWQSHDVPSGVNLYSYTSQDVKFNVNSTGHPVLFGSDDDGTTAFTLAEDGDWQEESLDRTVDIVAVAVDDTWWALSERDSSGDNHVVVDRRSVDGEWTTFDLWEPCTLSGDGAIGSVLSRPQVFADGTAVAWFSVTIAEQYGKYWVQFQTDDTVSCHEGDVDWTLVELDPDYDITFPQTSFDGDRYVVVDALTGTEIVSADDARPTTTGGVGFWHEATTDGWTIFGARVEGDLCDLSVVFIANDGTVTREEGVSCY